MWDIIHIFDSTIFLSQLPMEQKNKGEEDCSSNYTSYEKQQQQPQ